MFNDYYYLVSFDCFPLFLHFLTSLIKLILWLNFFQRQKAGEGQCLGQGCGVVGSVLLCFTRKLVQCPKEAGAALTHHTAWVSVGLDCPPEPLPPGRPWVCQERVTGHLKRR